MPLELGDAAFRRVNSSEDDIGLAQKPREIAEHGQAVAGTEVNDGIAVVGRDALTQRRNSARLQGRRQCS